MKLKIVKGDGSTLNDIIIAADCKSVQLRSERDGDGDGRVYTITFNVCDASGNFTIKFQKSHCAVMSESVG